MLICFIGGPLLGGKSSNISLKPPSSNNGSGLSSSPVECESVFNLPDDPMSAGLGDPSGADFQLETEGQLNFSDFPEIMGINYFAASCEKKFNHSDTNYITQVNQDLPLLLLGNGNDEESSDLTHRINWFDIQQEVVVGSQKLDDSALNNASLLDQPFSTSFPGIGNISNSFESSNLASSLETESKDVSQTEDNKSLPNLTFLTEILPPNDFSTFSLFENEDIKAGEDLLKLPKTDISHTSHSNFALVHHSTPKSLPRTYSRKRSSDSECPEPAKISRKLCNAKNLVEMDHVVLNPTEPFSQNESLLEVEEQLKESIPREQIGKLTVKNPDIINAENTLKSVEEKAGEKVTGTYSHSKPGSEVSVANDFAVNSLLKLKTSVNFNSQDFEQDDVPTTLLNGIKGIFCNT